MHTHPFEVAGNETGHMPAVPDQCLISDASCTRGPWLGRLKSSRMAVCRLVDSRSKATGIPHHHNHDCRLGAAEGLLVE